jgi:hypothetical protein
MYGAESIGSIVSMAEGLPFGAEPAADSVDHSGLGAVVVAAAVGQQVRISGVGDLRVAVER